MKIVVAIKQVPNAENVAINPITHDLMRGADNKMNPFDKYALESAFKLAAFYGDEVVAISMGPDQAKEVLAEAIAMGADQGILLSDRKFGGADTLATAYVLAEAIEKIDDVRLVIFGQQAVDADTGQVGPLVASQLAWPQLTYVDRLVDINAATVTVQRNLGPVTQTMIGMMELTKGASGSKKVTSADLAQDFYRAATDAKPKLRYFHSLSDRLLVRFIKTHPVVYRNIMRQIMKRTLKNNLHNQNRRVKVIK